MTSSTNDIRSIHLSVRRWRDKVNGNSYFAGRIFADGKLIAVMPFQYGYGSHPDAVALGALKDAGILFNDQRSVYLSSTCREDEIAFTTDDVSATKRDTKAHGTKD